MRKFLVAVLSMAAVACGTKEAQPPAATPMTLSSAAFGDGQPIPVQFTCDGDNISPPLAWDNVPAGTKSFVLVMDDPDAPSGTFRHWGAYAISASSRSLLAGAGLPSSAAVSQVMNGGDERSYAGPCPPKGHGVHHYRFKLYAISKAELDLAPDATVGTLEQEANGYKLGEALLTGTFERR